MTADVDQTRPSLDCDPERPLLAPTTARSNRRKNGITPLPWPQLASLLVVQLPEPIIATVIFPFIAELVNKVATGGDEKKVGFYAGMIESLFFCTEFIFILQWGRLSDRIGRRPVLLAGLLGLAVSIIAFGLSMTFWALIASRAIAGALCGNIGVAKAAISEITDETNMAQGFAYLPIVWAAGATMGPFIGGFLARPADRFPELFGGSTFLITFPYFLPCFVAGMSAVVAFAIAFVWLEETLPTIQKTPPSTPSKEAAAFLDESVTSYGTDGYTPAVKVQAPALPLSSLLTARVVSAILNYGLLALLDISFFALQPIFLALPVDAGGLGLAPSTVGLLLGGYGLWNGFIQMTMYAKIHSQFGTKKIYVAGVVSFIPLIIAFPVMNTLALRAEELPAIVWWLIAFQFFLCSIISMAFTSSFIFITASATSRSELGSTNGLAQTTASFMRAIGPASSTALFAVSVEQDSWLVYWTLLAVSCVAIGASALLPNKPLKDSDDEE